MDKPFLVSLTGSVGLEINFTELVMERLRTTWGGLSSEEAASRLLVFGLNKLDEKQVNRLWKFLGVMETAAVMAIILANTVDFVGIVCLLLLNSTISFIEENNAGNAVASLMVLVAHKAKVIRDGRSPVYLCPALINI